MRAWAWLLVLAMAGCTTTKKCGAAGDADVDGECDGGTQASSCSANLDPSAGTCFLSATYETQSWRVDCNAQGCTCTRPGGDGAPIDGSVTCGDASTTAALRALILRCGAPGACGQ